MTRPRSRTPPTASAPSARSASRPSPPTSRRQAEVERVAAAAGADRHPGQQRRRHPARQPAGRRQRHAARRLGPQGVRLHLADARALPSAARRKGVIVNVIGAAGETFDPGYIAGVAGNAALMAFTRASAAARTRTASAPSPSTPARSPPSAWSACSATAPKPSSATPTAGANYCAGMPYGRPAETGGDRRRRRLPRQPALRLHQRHRAHDQWRTLIG